MFKPFVLALLLLAARPAFAQTAPAARPTAPGPYQHCTLVSEGKFNYNARVFLEYGQTGKDGVQDPELNRDDVAVRKLRSAMAALNYLSKQGWECIGVSTLSSKVNPSSGSVDAETGYLLRRPAR